MNKILTKLISLLIALTMSTSLIAQTYSGGSGTSENPFQIANKADLKYLSEHSTEWGKYFKQTANIAFDDADFEDGGDFYNSGYGFIPIGNSTTNFTGSYDGDGYSIDNLYINRTSNDYIGFFGYLYNADIDNINLNAIDISGYMQTGGLAGSIDYGTIDDCFVSGSVSGANNSGGIAGDIRFRAVFNNCSTDVNVSGTVSVGGFAGRLYNDNDIDDNKPLITNSYATGNAIASDRNAGGFVGWTAGLISQCYATGNATCTNDTKSRVGGFAGAVALYDGSTGKIDNCYSLGDVIKLGTNNLTLNGIGGFVGIYYGSASITNCYSIGNVSPKGYYGGFCGLFTNGTSEGNYYNTETSGCDDTNANANPKTTREMQTQGTYANWDFMEESTNGTDNIWGISPLQNDGYPFLAWQGYDQYADTPDGSGTEAVPYQISTVAHLFWLAQNSQEWDKYYEQSTNIDATAAASWYDDAGFLPIGNENTGFAGYYDGQEHTISNLTIDRSSDDYIGLFGHIEGATIENLGITNVDIIGANKIGALSGKSASSSTIDSCYSTGTIEGAYVGGLIGVNIEPSEVKYCYNEATINAHSYAGGLIGQTSGLVKYCYNTGNVNGTSTYIGGLIGASTYYMPSNCYNIGQVNGYDYVGGLMGHGIASYCYNAGLVVCSQSNKGGLTGGGYSSSTSCYYDINTSGQSADPGSSHGLTTMEMQMEYQYKRELSYQSDWDFMSESTSGTWGISPLVNDGYPFLSWQGYELYGTEPDGSGTEEDPYVVDNLAELYWISQKIERWDDSYVQSGDIDAALTNNWCDGSGFLPIGSGDANDEFTGTYNGQGYIINHLWINRENEYQVGFIGKANASGQSIQNLGLPNAFIKGYKYVGGIVGFATGSDAISNCYISGSVIAVNDYAGGIIGYNNGTDLINCYSLSSVSGNDYVGGLIGELSYENVTNCYSKGLVTGNEYTGGLIGNGANYVSNSFWDTQTSGQASSAAGTGKTTAEMKTLTTFTDETTVGLTSAWDFIGNPNDDSGSEDYWSIDGTTNSGYPFLSWEAQCWDGGNSKTTDWFTDSNWQSGSVPTSSDDVSISNTTVMPTISGSTTAVCNDLIVADGSTLTIEDDGELTISGDLTNSGTVTVQSNADGTGSLIVEGTATGNVTVQRYLTEGKWHYISAPVNDTRIFDEFLGLTGGANNDQFYWWDEDGTYNGSTGIWFDILNNPTGISYTDNSFLHSQGYAITYAGSGSETINFSGVPYTENKTITITRTGESRNPGVSLVGNPFTSTIAINDDARIGDGDDANNYFIYQNASLLAVDYQAIYLWDESQSDYVAKNNGIGATFIAPGQGFMVVGKNASSSLAFNKNTRKHGAAPFYKNGNDNQRLELLVVDTENHKNSAIITFLPDMTLGLDPSYDAAKFKGNPDIALYTKLVEDNGIDFAIQALPPLIDEKLEVKIGLDVSTAGGYNFKLIESENFERTTSIKLEDKATGELIDFRETEKYSFNINEQGQIRDRFVLHFNNSTGIEDQNPETENIRFYVYDNKLYIIDKELKKGTIQLFNMLGQPVVEKRYSETVNTLDLNLSTGYYIVRIITDKTLMSGKIYVE
ncbi:MAG: T9SS type A sorting domain-containing protein [Bacteroidales bacterium]|nr:T9SS type A sorting domain-containing protein [Bacteroidales bacterium]